MGQGRSCRKAKAVDLCWTTLLCGMVWANSGSPAFAGKLRSDEMRVPVVTRPVPDSRPDVTSARALTDAFESDAYISAKTPALSTGTASMANRPVIAVDIDETLSKTDYTGLLWGIGGDNSTPLPGAQATLRRLSMHFDVVYVTARSRSLARKTERWLERYGFPKGRLVTSPTLGEFLLQSSFKRNVLSQLRSEYPNMVVGIGDKAADAKAYRAARMFPVIVNPWSNQKYRTDDVVLRDWSAVSDFFDANIELLSNSRRMNQSLNNGQVEVKWPGVRRPLQPSS